MGKPKLLYHASSSKDIEVFEPRAESIRHPDEGPVVFAGESKEGCTVFLVPTTGDWVELGAFGDGKGNKFSYAVISDEKRFKASDKGGAIYTLSSDTFVIDERYGSNREWTSREPVKPIHKEVYDSGLDAMLSAGIQVYFVDQDTFQKIKQSDDHGYQIIKTLISENSRLNINPKKLD